MFARSYKVASFVTHTTRRPSLLGSSGQWTRQARTYASESNHHPSVTRRVLRPVYVAGATALAVGFTVYSFDSRAGLHRYVVTPLMRYFLDAEQAHRWAVDTAKWGIVPRDWKTDDDTLRVTIWGRELTNPIGLAAGFDKNAECIDGMFNLGFGTVEIGSVTPEPQPGNPKPRVFRLTEDNAIINRYGFNSQGHQAVLEHLRTRKRHHRAYGKLDTYRSFYEQRLLGINLGKNKTSPEDSGHDFVLGVQRLGHLADYLVVNVSSPNTPGLRGMQRKDVLFNLLQEVKQARDALAEPRPPLLVKIAPDLSDGELQDIAAVVHDCQLDGIIVANTTVQRPSTLKSVLARETGGLSGPPVRPMTLHCLREMYRLTGGTVPLIACGGVQSGKDALEYARAGATTIQLYTGMVYEGPGIVRRIKDEIVQELNGKRWTDVIGEDVKQRI
ncbi:Dihydroorotate dehydrogenase-domain-containing protein [Syncephalis plumigaleata]|nr:Dihydroorotate dehydrogenase-domain-containing protein [Syncephalis plumigaleata]